MGVLGGLGNLYTFDLDDHADDVPCAKLTDPRALHKWRANAPERISFAFRCDEPLPAATHKHAGQAGSRGSIEVKAAGQQAVWAGVHESGAVIRTAGDTIPTLTRAEVAALWLYRTGETLPDPAQPKERTQATPGTYAPRDDTAVEAIKAAWPPSAVFQRHGFGTPTTENRRELRFRGHGGLLCDDAGGAWYSFADQVGGDSIDAWAYCRRLDATGDFLAIVDEMADAAGLARLERRRSAPDAAEPDRQNTAAKIDALRLALRAVDFADLVPVELQSVAGYRTAATDRVVADAALDILQSRGTLQGRISGLALSEKTGKSVNTCIAAMKRLRNIFEPVTIDDGDNSGRQAQAYRISNCVDCNRIPQAVTLLQSTQLPLADKAHDAFVRSLTAMTPADVDAENARRDAAGHKPMRPSRQLQRRLDALADAPGPDVLLMLDAVAMYGPLTRDALGAVLYRGASGISRTVQKGIKAGLLVEDGHRIDIAPDWKTRVDEIDATCPNAGTLQRRRLAAIDARLRYTAAALENPARTADERAHLYRRQNAAQVAKMRQIAADVADHNARRDAAGLEPVAKSVILAPGATLDDFLRWQRAQQRGADDAKLALRTLAKELSGLEYDDARHFATLAGYTDADFGRAWALR